MEKVRDGSILISEPFLGDPNFERTVVLVCKHDEEGSFGLVLNRLSTLKLSDVLEYEPGFDSPLSVGGPMEYNTLHYIHRLPEIAESIVLNEGLYWGGDYEQLLGLISGGQIDAADIRFFLGYSGWSPGQLEEEVDKNVWIVNNNASDKLFTLDAETLWRQILKEMGGKYKVLANYPIDPSLN